MSGFLLYTQCPEVFVWKFLVWVCVYPLCEVIMIVSVGLCAPIVWGSSNPLPSGNPSLCTLRHSSSHCTLFLSSLPWPSFQGPFPGVALIACCASWVGFLTPHSLLLLSASWSSGPTVRLFPHPQLLLRVLFLLVLLTFLSRSILWGYHTVPQTGSFRRTETHLLPVWRTGVQSKVWFGRVFSLRPHMEEGEG